MADDDLQAEAANPETSSQRLGELAAKHPDLWETIAANPSADEGVLYWLKTRGGDQVAAAIAAREAGTGEDAPAEDVAAEDVAAEDAAAEEPAADEATAEDAPVEETATDEAAVDEVPVEETAADEVPVDADSSNDAADGDTVVAFEDDPADENAVDPEDEKSGSGTWLAVAVVVALLVGLGTVFAVTGGNDDDDVAASDTATSEPAGESDDPAAGDDNDAEPSDDPADQAAAFCAAMDDLQAASADILRQAASTTPDQITELSGPLEDVAAGYEALAADGPEEIVPDVELLSTFYRAVADDPETTPDTTGLREASQRVEAYATSTCA
ncbi:hypothetical protein [Aeromicrobium marinum]|uniref:variant leucine-rich repeat-containing protein n=1 Tax=Aeromicrobium marinum TaxID=219314 RepID=UPI0006821968|nr:hypothetical protein [Aeromicrobium marinum]